MTSVAAKDYVFVKNESEEGEQPPSLYKVLSVSIGKFTGRLEKDPHLARSPDTISVNRVIANLGKQPHPGKAYGYDLAARYRKTVDTDYASLHIYCKVTKSKLEEVVKAFNRVGRRMEKAGLGGLYSRNIEYQLRPKQGKWAGYFAPSKDSEKKPHRLVASPDSQVESLDYLFLHELGHAIHSECLMNTPELLAMWQKLYNRTVLPTEVSKKEADLYLSRWLKSQTDGGYSVRDLARHAEEDEEKQKINAVVSWIAKNHGVKSKELDLLMYVGEHDEVKALWPTRSISSKRNLKPVVSEYSTVAVQELIAESFSFYMLKKTLPEKVTKLVQKSIALAKADLR